MNPEHLRSWLPKQNVRAVHDHERFMREHNIVHGMETVAVERRILLD
jgi:hypothetical protein